MSVTFKDCFNIVILFSDFTSKMHVHVYIYINVLIILTVFQSNCVCYFSMICTLFAVRYQSTFCWLHVLSTSAQSYPSISFLPAVSSLAPGVISRCPEGVDSSSLFVLPLQLTYIDLDYYILCRRCSPPQIAWLYISCEDDPYLLYSTAPCLFALPRNMLQAHL